MKFEWDENKNKSNFEKHRIDFNEAKEVFKDENAVNYEIENSLKKYKEQRFLTIGKFFNVLHTVVWTFRSVFIRLISFRRANKNEQKIYKNQDN